MSAKSPPPKSIPELEAAALRALGNRSYKDAIAQFKELLKRERRGEWEERLAAAYLGRAREVAAKGMFQEAAVLWENHAGCHPGMGPSAEYLGWLLQGGQLTKLAKALADAPDTELAGPAGRRLMESVALLALSHDKLLGALPASHPIAGQQPLLRQAIQDYAEGRDGAAETALRQVPSRSPYRNLRTLLKGLLRLEQDPAAARDTFSRLDAESVCQPAAQAIAAPLDAAPVAAVGKLQAVSEMLSGYSKAQGLLLRDLRKAGQAKGLRPLLEQIIRHRAELGDGPSRRFVLASLPACPEAIPLYERAFGKLGAFEINRLKALHAEENKQHARAAQFWDGCLDQLRSASHGQQDALTQALICRHVAMLAEHEAPPVALEYLEQSLKHDPEDKATYLKLIALNEEEQAPKAAQTWLERALKHFPRDHEVLVLAMQSAQRRKAFKQVAAQAKTLLEVDPINSQARRFLLESHLGHARKQLKGQRFAAAGKELAAASKLDPQRRNAALLYLEGTLAYLEADNERCRGLWREAWQAAGGGVAAWLQWAMEILGAGLPLTGPSKLLDGLDKNYQAGKADLMALTRLLGTYAQDSPAQLGQALKTLAPIVKRGIKLAGLGEDDFAGLCQGLVQAGQFDLLAVCAKEGFRRFHAAPRFGYYEAVAKCRDNPARLSAVDEDRLYFALDRAAAAQDRRTVALIDGFLRRRDNAFPPRRDLGFPFGSVDEDDAIDPAMLEELEELKGLSPEKMVQRLMGDLSPAELQKMSPEDLVQALFGKFIEGADITPEEILEAMPRPGRPARAKSRKKR